MKSEFLCKTGGNVKNSHHPPKLWEHREQETGVIITLGPTGRLAQNRGRVCWPGGTATEKNKSGMEKVLCTD